MTIKTLLTCSVALFLLISCGEESTNNNTTTSSEETTTPAETPAETPTPAPLSAEDKMKAADAMMAQIEAAKHEQNVEKKRYANPKEVHDQSIYVVYSQDGKMVKLTENMGESMYAADAAYYYQDDNIFMIHTVSSFDDNVYNETKVYFEEGQPVAAMGRSKEEQDMDTDLNSLPMEKQELSKAIYNMEEYMNGLAKIPARLAASTPE